MATRTSPSKVTSLQLPEQIGQEVMAWRNQGYHPLPSETTRHLLNHWFSDEREGGQQFHECQRRHGLAVAYRDENGLMRTYEVDFLLRTADTSYLLETKSDKDMALPSVGLKARAAQHWCQSMTGTKPPISGQPVAWEYLLLSESLFRDNRGMSFTGLLPLMRQARDRLVAAEQGTLFA